MLKANKIIRNNLLALASLMGCLVLSAPASANDIQTIEQIVDREPILCEALNDRNSYTNENGWDDYKVLANGKDGWLFRSRFDFKYRFKITDRSQDFFYRLGDAFRQNGTELVIAMLPTRGITSPDKITGRWKEHYNVEKARNNYRDMVKTIEGTGIPVATIDDFDNHKDFYLYRDNHWSEAGAKAMAKELRKELENFEIYGALPKHEFVETEIEVPRERYPNLYEDVARKICGFPPNEYVVTKAKIASKANNEISEDALFGDAEKPSLVLLGTSNTTDTDPSFTNFPGHLKIQTGLDLTNESISGGALQGAITNYLVKGRYAQNKPKIAIWEMSAHYGYNQQDFFREVIPAVHGKCSDEDAVLKTTIVLPEAGGETILFDSLKQYNLSGSKYYVALNIEDKETRNIKLRFMHGDKRIDTIDLRRSRRHFAETNGAYFAELNGIMKDPLSQIVLNAKRAKGSVEARICEAPAPVSPRPGDLAMADKTSSGEGLWEEEKTFSWREFLFGKDNIDVLKGRDEKIAKQKQQQVEKIALPDVSGFTLEEVLKKIPKTKPGKISIAQMEGAPPLRKFAFDKRLIEARELQGRVKPLAIHIYDGTLTFEQLAETLADTDFIVKKSEGYIVRLPIAVYPEANLIFKNIDRPVLFSQDKGGFLVAAGNLYIVNSQLKGWDETNNKPAELIEDWTNFRPFITTWDGSRLYMANAQIHNMGYAASKSYGISISTNSVVQEEFFEEFGDLLPPSGWIVNTEFHNMYFGFYSYEAEDFVLYKNKYIDNVLYGIDPHDRSERLIIAYNHVTGTLEKHGIIISREVNDSFIFNNISEYNKGSGFMLDRMCENTVLANNVASFNEGDGITLYESPHNTLINNVMEHNQNSGLRLRNSWGVKIYGGRIAMNKSQAIIAYQDSLTHTKRDFEMDPVTQRVQAHFSNVELESNMGLLKTKGFAELSFSNMNWDKGTITSRKYYGDIKEFENQITKYDDKYAAFTLVNTETFPAPATKHSLKNNPAY